ncbi:MAG: response regulator [Bdellovibrionota bacterium]
MDASSKPEDSSQTIQPEKLREYLADKKALVFDYSSASRATVRKILGVFQVKPGNIDAADNYQEAQEKLKTKQPQVIFCDYELGGKQTGLDFFQMVKEIYPSRLDTVFILISERNSDALASQVAEQEVDAMVVRPFTHASLEKKFLEVMSSKVAPSKAQVLIEAGKALLAAKKYDESLKSFQQVNPQDPQSSSALYYQSLVCKALGKPKEQQRLLEEGLKRNPIHYKCLCGLFEVMMEIEEYKKAYGICSTLNQNHPVNPSRIPDFVWLSVVNGEYEDIMNYYQIFTELDAPDDTILTYISAGLVICGKYFLRQSNESNALAAFQKASTVSKNKVSILKEIIITLFKAGMMQPANEYLSRASDEVRHSSEILIAELEGIEKTASIEHVVQRCLELLKQGVKTEKVYELAIQGSRQMNRPANSIQELVDEASLAFPQSKQKFASSTPTKT